MDWWTLAISVLSSLAAIMFTRLTMPHFDLRKYGICFLLMIFFLNYCDNKPMNCGMPSRFDSDISLAFCSFRELTDLSIFKSYENMTKLNVSYNNLQRLHADVFIYNLKLVDLDLSYNPDLGKDYQGTECIIKSDSLRKLNLAFTGYGLIQPESICAPVKSINLVGVDRCELTRSLFKQKKPFVFIFCGGSYPEAISESSTFSPLNTQSSTIRPTTTTGDSASQGLSETSMTNSSGATTQQPVTASASTSASASADGGPDEDPEPINSEGTPVAVWVGLGVVGVVLVIIAIHVIVLCVFPRSKYADFWRTLRNIHICVVLRNFFCAPRNRSIHGNETANTRENSETSPGDNESDAEQSTFLNR
ncbi:hypothetical protein R5R35_000202 [Gryllus longicercus]|uniref:Uncharacterized protein n=1 Tax=Gryllus longicercus TaxID=2509291 RepID=A0AAN9WAZ2_9ORTH